jgi:transcriptional regulator with XRE-family HTH domain
MSTNKNVVSQAVRDLRHAYEESQQAFAYRTKSAIRTIARYETVRPPRGAELGQFLELAIAKGRSDLAEIFGKAMADEFNMKAERIPRTMEENIYADLLFLMMRNRQHSPKVARSFQETTKHLFDAYDVLKRRFHTGARVDGIDAEDLEILDGDVEVLKRAAAEKDSK